MTDGISDSGFDAFAGQMGNAISLTGEASEAVDGGGAGISGAMGKLAIGVDVMVSTLGDDGLTS